MNTQMKSQDRAELLLLFLESELNLAEELDKAMEKSIDRFLGRRGLRPAQKKVLKQLRKDRRKCGKRIEQMRSRVADLRARF